MEKEIYIESKKLNEPLKAYKTAKNLLAKLEKETPWSDNAQLVIQLKKDADGEEWKMFIYYGFFDKRTEDPTYMFSFQSLDMETDTMPELARTRGKLLARIWEELKEVGGCQWMAVDYDEHAQGDKPKDKSNRMPSLLEMAATHSNN